MVNHIAINSRLKTKPNGQYILFFLHHLLLLFLFRFFFCSIVIVVVGVLENVFISSFQILYKSTHKIVYFINETYISKDVRYASGGHTAKRLTKSHIHKYQHNVNRLTTRQRTNEKKKQPKIHRITKSSTRKMLSKQIDIERKEEEKKKRWALVHLLRKMENDAMPSDTLCRAYCSPYSLRSVTFFHYQIVFYLFFFRLFGSIRFLKIWPNSNGMSLAAW